MSFTKFATICDKCQARSEEYSRFEACVKCITHVCPECTYPGTSTDEGECLCEECGLRKMADELRDPEPFFELPSEESDDD